MLTIRTSDHIRTKGNLRGLHSCRTATGFPKMHLDARRLSQQEAALITRILRRAWIEQLWSLHQLLCRQLRRA